MLTTWSLVLIVSFGYSHSNVVVIPNFVSYDSCQKYSESLQKRLDYRREYNNVYECVPSNYGRPARRLWPEEDQK